MPQEDMSENIVNKLYVDWSVIGTDVSFLGDSSAFTVSPLLQHLNSIILNKFNISHLLDTKFNFKKSLYMSVLNANEWKNLF